MLVEDVERPRPGAEVEGSQERIECNEPHAQIRANPEKVESAIASTRVGLIQAVCWAGGQQRWASPTRMT
jgi:hypothetical protein